MKKTGIKISDMGEHSLICKPPGFWISLDGGWEEWCISEEFRDVQKATICDVYLNPNLTFIRISTVQNANELFLFLMPELTTFRFLDRDYPSSDRMTLLHYQIDELNKGNIVTARKVWANALNCCDGVYYEDLSNLHFETIFNAWDCSSIILFDPRNVTISKQQ